MKDRYLFIYILFWLAFNHLFLNIRLIYFIISHKYELPSSIRLMSSDSYQHSPRKRSPDRSRSREKDRKNQYESIIDIDIDREKRVKMKMPEITQNLYSLRQFTSLQV